MGRVIFFCGSFAGALFLLFLLLPSLTVFYATIASFFRCDGAFMTSSRFSLCSDVSGTWTCPFFSSFAVFFSPACFSSRFFCFFSFLFLCVLPLPTFLHVRLRSPMRSLRSARCVFFCFAERRPQGGKPLRLCRVARGTVSGAWGITLLMQ